MINGSMDLILETPFGSIFPKMSVGVTVKMTHPATKLCMRLARMMEDNVGLEQTR